MDLERAAVEAAEHGTHFAVAFNDIDEFGKFNKVFGQDVGDTVLQAVAQVLQDSWREGDVVYRLGGEEFVALFPGATVEEAGRARTACAARVEEQVHRRAAGPTRTAPR